MPITLTDEQIATLKQHAERRVWTDNEDFMTDDYSGGNVDDAFQGGHRDGYTTMAREILDMVGVVYEIEQ